MSKVVRFQGTMFNSLSEAGGGTLSSTPFCGAIGEAHRDVGLISWGRYVVVG